MICPKCKGKKTVVLSCGAILCKNPDCLKVTISSERKKKVRKKKANKVNRKSERLFKKTVRVMESMRGMIQ